MKKSEARAVLVVDDEDIVLSLLRRSLARGGYAVLEAGDGAKAIKTFEARRSEIAGVILDLSMPVMDGEETLIELQKLDPDVRVILSSGYPKEEATARFGSLGVAGFIHKPFRPTELLGLVQELFGPAKAQ